MDEERASETTRQKGLADLDLGRFDPREPRRWLIFAFVGLALVAVGAAIGLGVGGAGRGSDETIFLLLGIIAGAVFAIPGLVLIGLAVHSRLTELLYGEVRWSVQPDELRLGEKLTVDVSFDPLFSGRIGGVFASLRATEIVEHRSPRFRFREKRVLYQKHVALTRAMETIPGDTQSWSRTFETPRGKPASGLSGDRDVKWTVELRVSIPWWPDLRRKRKITVRPGVGSGESEARKLESR